MQTENTFKKIFNFNGKDNTCQTEGLLLSLQQIRGSQSD